MWLSFYTRNKVQGTQLFEKVQPSSATHFVNKIIGNIYLSHTNSKQVKLMFCGEGSITSEQSFFLKINIWNAQCKIILRSYFLLLISRKVG